MTDDTDKKTLGAALQGLEYGASHIALELRRMADADPSYRCFTYASPMIKNVWRAAADLLEKGAR